MGFQAELLAHLKTGVTTTCRAWAITRKDGVTFGFTDHDCALEFDGIRFKADTGMSAMALSRSTGLSVDNTDALGALSDMSVREEDIEAGRFDGAEVRAWLVNWALTAERQVLFRGQIGEIERAGGAFKAELRGLTEKLNRPIGRVFQKPSTEVPGFGEYGFDYSTPGYTAEVAVAEVVDCTLFRFADLDGYEPGWFEHGRFEVLSGAATGLFGVVKRDRTEGELRQVNLWHPIRAEVRVGDIVKIYAGSDRRMETARLKFNNLFNFQGFPDLPSEDWLLVQPGQSGVLTGGSRR